MKGPAIFGPYNSEPHTSPVEELVAAFALVGLLILLLIAPAIFQ